MLMQLEDPMDDILERASRGMPITRDEIAYMYNEVDIKKLGMAARLITDGITGRQVSFVSNMIYNYTNICNVRCKFCAFYRTGKEEDAYTLTPDEIVEHVRKMHDAYGIRQLLIQGGVNPDLGISYYKEVFSKIKQNIPDIGINGLSTSEISYISRKEKMSVEDTLKSLRESGLDTIPGAGAEIFDDEVRKILRRPPGSGDQWLDVMETAHRIGLKTSATMMFGHVENSYHKADHLLSLLKLQEKYHGFLSFTPWNFEPGNTELEKEGLVSLRVGGEEVLRNIAISRIVLNRHIPVIQSSWLTNGVEMGQMAIYYGANDWGGTIYDEKVIPATGKKVGNLRKETIIRAIRNIGMVPVERDNGYRIVKTYL
ncbi:MAG: dehypoxanthine futalosine cyclase [Candidatus Thermoplasmatota archaeon]|nr:dehypoxanthine futalosine cyclase [Candidatus Thermoplasmatota archaeon]